MNMAEYDDPEESLRFSIWFALQQCRFRPPKTHDRTESNEYHRRAAEAVMKQIKLSGWTIERLVMKKHPPIK